MQCVANTLFLTLEQVFGIYKLYRIIDIRLSMIELRVLVCIDLHLC